MPRALPLSVFCSYADTDKRYVERLQKHVTLLVKDGLITAWTRQMIVAGNDWEQEVHSHLQAADIILLLVSADFIAHPYCYEREVACAMERHQEGLACVVPILARPCEWETAPFGGFRPLPTTGFIRGGWNGDKDYLNIVKELRKLVAELVATKPVAESGTRARSKPPPALPVLVNRRKQDAQLKTALESRLPGRPFLCIVHGDESADHDGYLRRLRAYWLPRILELGPNVELAPPNTLDWPRDAETRAEVFDRLGSDLRDLIGNQAAQGNAPAGVQRPPVLIYTEVLSADWGSTGKDVLKWVLDYWNEYPSFSPEQKLIVLIFVKYQLNQGKTARRYPERDRDLEQHLTDDPLKGYNSLSGKVLPVLHMVKLGEAKSWLAHPEILKYYDGDELGAQSPRIEQLFVNVEEMPMRDLVPKLAEVLDLCRRIA